MNFLLLGLTLLATIKCWARDDQVVLGKAIPVDFYVFRGKDGSEQNVAPRTSMNINPPDNATGFPALCKDRCPYFQEECGPGCLAPQMRWCRCVAELLANDLSFDFGVLLGGDSPAIFTLGDYVEVSEGQEFFDVRDGHSTLYSLMDADGSRPYARRSGRVTVWVANHIQTPDAPDSMLAGTTLLDQPLWVGGKGAGVLLHAGNDRSGKVLSHEVGHVVGFHHTAGPSMMYKYDHPECPKACQHVETHPLVFPTCEVNIMGYWYDGPYCCPGASASFLQHLRRGKCLPMDLSNFKEAYCCGNECSHSCPKKMPEPTFATKEHKESLSKMLQCWMHLRTVREPKKPAAVVGMMNMTSSGLQRSFSTVCVDYGRELGTCTSSGHVF